MTEEKEVAAPKGTRGAFQHSAPQIAQKATPINSIETKEKPRTKTEMEELNRVLGGGIVSGSLVLIGGDPGIGKSTLLLQVSALLAKAGKKVLYISGEESIRQTKMRAERLDAVSGDLLIFAETNLELTEAALDKIAKEGYDPEYGARPLRRSLQKYVEDRLSEELLKGTAIAGQRIIFDVQDEEFIVRTNEEAVKKS